MTIKVGEKIKLLRKKHDVTQEKLADYLGVTAQAVSRWESENGYPDIELLAAIASFFQITTDELLCVSNAKQEERVKWYLDEIARYDTIGDEKKAFDTASEAYREFPFHFKIMRKYIWKLTYDPYVAFTDNNHCHDDEVEKICNLILEDCTDDEARYSAIQCLADVTERKYGKEKALKIIMRLPKDYTITQPHALEHFYGEYSEKGIKQRKENIESLCELLCHEISVTAGIRAQKEDGYIIDVDEQIDLYRKNVTIFELIYENGDFNFYHSRMHELYWRLTGCYIKKGAVDIALDCLEKSVDFAVAYDTLPDEKEYTSYLVKGNIFQRSGTSCGTTKNECARALDALNEYADFYKPISGSDRYNVCIEKLKKYAKA